MANTKFDSKSFNPVAFKYATERLANVKKNELIKSKVLKNNQEIQHIFKNQDGASYARLAIKGLLDGDVINYDGATDITATYTKTFEQGVVALGRAKAWVEQDFSRDITAGIDFMDNVVQQVGEYWFNVDQNLLLSILKGIFNMIGDTKSLEFVDKHTYDITDADGGAMTSTTLNSAMQLACGDNKKKFSLVFMCSMVATNLENLNLIKHLTYTDKDGLTRDIELYSWNGRSVIVDDSLDDGTGEYITYILGDGAFSYENIGVSVPYEMSRDPYKNGGNDTLITRARKCFAPYGISYEKVNQATLSPTNAELEDGSNWCLVHSGESDETTRTYLNHRAIPIARIISKG